MKYAHSPDSLRRHVAQQRLLKELSAEKTFRLQSEVGPVSHPDFSKAILARDPRCFLDGTILHIPQHPYICCVYNRNAPWAPLKLHLVCGSLGFGTGSSPWYEFGTPEYRTHDDFMAGHPVAWDWHVWLEDDGRRVWDVCDAFWHDLAAARGHRILIGDAETTAVIKGETLDHLKAKGLHYAAAPLSIQHTLLDAAECLFSPYYDFFKPDAAPMETL